MPLWESLLVLICCLWSLQALVSSRSKHWLKAEVIWLSITSRCGVVLFFSGVASCSFLVFSLCCLGLHYSSLRFVSLSQHSWALVEAACAQLASLDASLRLHAIKSWPSHHCLGSPLQGRSPWPCILNCYLIQVLLLSMGP